MLHSIPTSLLGESIKDIFIKAIKVVIKICISSKVIKNKHFHLTMSFLSNGSIAL